MRSLNWCNHLNLSIVVRFISVTAAVGSADVRCSLRAPRSTSFVSELIEIDTQVQVSTCARSQFPNVQTVKEKTTTTKSNKSKKRIKRKQLHRWWILLFILVIEIRLYTNNIARSPVCVVGIRVASANKWKAHQYILKQEKKMKHENMEISLDLQFSWL